MKEAVVQAQDHPPHSIGGATAHGYDIPFVRNLKQNKAVIVFVHGVTGDAKSTWSDGNHYWPAMLLDDPAFDGQNIYVYEYPSPKLGKTFSIDEIVDNMRLVLSADGVLSHDSITFVAHSMGGLVTRAFLLKYRQFVPKIRFLYFFATPTTGSPVATLASLFSNNPQFGDMYPMDGDGYLGPLQSSWLAANFGLKSYCGYETLPTYGVTVVDRQSATNLCNERLDPIDANHITIVKPSSPTSTSYRALKAAMQDTDGLMTSSGAAGSKSKSKASPKENAFPPRTASSGPLTAGPGSKAGAVSPPSKTPLWLPTGDYLIDDVQAHLNQLADAGTSDDGELTNVLRPLFNQPVFVYIGEEVPESALFRFCRTSHLLAYYINRFSDPSLRASALQSTQKLILLQDIVATLYGPALSAQVHCNQYGDSKSEFMSKLPSRMNDRSEITAKAGVALSDLQNSLRAGGLMDSPPKPEQENKQTIPPSGNIGSLNPTVQATSRTATGSIVSITDEAGRPLAGVEVLVLKGDGTHLTKVRSDTAGKVQLEEKISVPVTILAAAPGFHSYYQENYILPDAFAISMKAYIAGGSVVIDNGTGYVPGLDGRLNPILDSLNRTYLYAENIAIDGGKIQPVPFTTKTPFRVNDHHDHLFQLEVTKIVGSSSLIEYVRLAN